MQVATEDKLNCQHKWTHQVLEHGGMTSEGREGHVENRNCMKYCGLLLHSVPALHGQKTALVILKFPPIKNNTRIMTEPYSILRKFHVNY